MAKLVECMMKAGVPDADRADIQALVKENGGNEVAGVRAWIRTLEAGAESIRTQLAEQGIKTDPVPLDTAIQVKAPKVKKSRKYHGRNGDSALHVLASRGGVRDDEGHSLRKAMNLQKLIPGLGMWIRQNGMSIDAASELLWDEGFFGAQNDDAVAGAQGGRPGEADVIKFLQKAVQQHPLQIPDIQAETAQNRVDAEQSAITASRRKEIEKAGAEANLALTAADIDSILDIIGRAGLTPADAIDYWIENADNDAIAAADNELPDREFGAEIADAFELREPEGQADAGAEGRAGPAPVERDAGQGEARGGTDDRAAEAQGRDVEAAPPAAPEKPKTEKIAPISVVPDDGAGVANAQYAVFWKDPDDEQDTYVQFAIGKDGNTHLLSINAESRAGPRGREIVRWLKTAYGRPIIVHEPSFEAVGFWEQMEKEGLTQDTDENQFEGKTIDPTAKTEKIDTVDGKRDQGIIPGAERGDRSAAKQAEKDTLAEAKKAQEKADFGRKKRDTKMRPTKPQKEATEGLFGDGRGAQPDLLKPQGKASIPSPGKSDLKSVSPATLRDRLRKAIPDERVVLRVVKLIEDINNGKATDDQGRYFNRIIEIATALDAETYNLQSDAWVLDHELVHALRDLGVIKPSEWTALSKAAVRSTVTVNGKTRNRLAEIRERYADKNLTEDELIEEAVADYFADWRTSQDAKGFVRQGFEGIVAFFRAIGRWLAGSGLTTPDAIMRAMAGGKIGRRRGTAPAGLSPRAAAAWHGSPYDYDEFSTDKIGTGEGAQAYGWGLYFSGQRAVAQFYRDKLAKANMDIRWDGTRAPDDLARSWVAFKILQLIHNSAPLNQTQFVSGKATYDFYAGRIADALGGAVLNKANADTVGDAINGAADRFLEREQAYPDERESVERMVAAARGAVEHIKVTHQNKGRLYKVELAPAEDEYLLWDKPLSEQSEKVKAALQKQVDSDAERGRETPAGYAIELSTSADYTGEMLYERLVSDNKEYWTTEKQKAASELLRALGIRGNKYLDQGSRGQAVVRGVMRDGVEKWSVTDWSKPSPSVTIYDTQAEAKAAAEKLSTYNYVIFDQADVKITEKSSRARVKVSPEVEEAMGKAIQPDDERPMGQRLREDFNAIKAGFKDDLTYGVADEFVGLLRQGRALDPNAVDSQLGSWVAAGQARRVSGIIQAMMLWGGPGWNSDTQSITNDGTGGFFDILAPLFKGGLEKVFDGYAYARRVRTQNLIAQGREQNLTEADVDALLAEGQKYPEVVAAYDKVQSFMKKVLDTVEAMGLINAEQRAVWEKMDYVPFYRVAEEDGARAPRSRRGLANQGPGIKKLTGEGKRFIVVENATGKVQPVRYEELELAEAERNSLGASEYRVEAAGEAIPGVIENVSRNITHLIGAALKNVASRMAIDEAVELGTATKVKADFSRAVVPFAAMTSALRKGGADILDTPEGMAAVTAVVSPVKSNDPKNRTIAIRRDGVVEYYELDDKLVYYALNGMNTAAMNPIWKPFVATKNFLTRAITLMPGFMARNFVRDSASAWLLNGDRGYNFYTEMAKSVKSLTKDVYSPEVRAMMAAGFDTGWYATAPEEMVDQIREFESEQRIGIMHPGSWLHHWQRFGRASELANRRVAFQSTLAKTGDVRRSMAEAADLMDFQKRGGSDFVQWFTAVTPFINARIQGLYKLGRVGFQDNPAARKAFAVKASMMVSFSLVLAALNATDDDDDGYNDLPEYMKDGSWVLPVYRLFGEDVAKEVGLPRFVLIPKPFELGVLFGTVPERAVQVLAGNDRWKDTSAAIGRALLSTFEINPVGTPIAKELVEQWANKDFYTGMPIVNEALWGVAPEERYNPDTSYAARWFARAMPDLAPEELRSPVNVEHAVKGFTGTLGVYTLAGIDAAVRALDSLGSTRELPKRPERRLDEIEVVRSFMTSDPMRGSKWTERFYEIQRQADDISQSINRRLKEGDRKGAVELQKENRVLLSLRPALNKQRSKLSEVRKQINQVQNDLKMSPVDKRNKIDRLLEIRNRLTKSTTQAAERRMLQ